MSERYKPLAVANEFIGLASPGGVDHMKLQKLIYLTLGHWLAEHEDSFLTEEPQVWQYGPVFGDLYQKLKNFRREPIAVPVRDPSSSNVPRVLPDPLPVRRDRDPVSESV